MLKRSFFVLPLVLFCFIGCAQKAAVHDIHSTHKIPIDGKRWYQLTNASTNLEVLFNNNPSEKPNTGYNKLVEHYDAWYPLMEGELMEIDSIMFFCYRNIDKAHPLTIYAVDSQWRRTLIATFTGQRYNQWDGPDPATPDVFALKQRAVGFRYLVMNTWGEFPGEIEFYGAYKPATITKSTVKKFPLSNYFGVNAYEWNFDNNKIDAVQLNQDELKSVGNFTGFRHYLDWEKLEHTEGNYTFNPARNGGWNYDSMYTWCKLAHKDVLVCLKTIPDWMQSSYPKGQRNNENVPARFGKDLLNPASYIEQAKVGFQFAARYGANTKVASGLVRVDKSLRWQGDKANEVRIGLNLVQYIECDNERDKWWKGRNAYQTGREYAANLSAFYDGHKGKLGAGVGVKNADPAMKVVMAGVAAPVTDYVMGIIDWSKEFRGCRKDGSVDLPFDIINYHYYANDANDIPDKEATVGKAPELTNAGKIADDFVNMSHVFAGDLPVWVTEAGYDINSHSTQRAIAIGAKSVEETQGDWILRTSLLYARHGIARVFFYQLYDDDGTSTIKYGTSGLVEVDGNNRPAADFLQQVNGLFGGFVFDSTLSTAPIVDRYTNHNEVMYALVVPDEKGRVGSYTLDLGMADTAYIYSPKAGSVNMLLGKQATKNGKVTIKVTETPVFVTTQLNTK